MTVKNKEFTPTNLKKPYWPQEGITKGDVLKYYLKVGKEITEHIKDRPLSLNRFPNGVQGKSFFQKRVPDNTPPWVRSEMLHLSSRGRFARCFVGEDIKGLLWLANQGSIEFHGWLSRIDNIDEPDLAVIDLDPARGATWNMVVKVARSFARLLKELNLKGFPKTSGGRGLHIYLPVQRGYSFSDTRSLVEGLGKVIKNAMPAMVALYERRVEERWGKVYIDYLQNGRGKTMVVPYSLRPFPGAPVSTPLLWEEVTEGLDPRTLNIYSVEKLLQRRGDTYEPLGKCRQEIRGALERLAR